MLEKIQHLYHKFELTIGSLKFAVIIIAIFSLAMTVGTFVESYHGTEFAARTVYKTWPFMLLQFFMFLSILFATFHRLPPKKRLYGFYVIHTGLIMIGVGSAITYLAGIDGNIHLQPNTPSRRIMLSDDILVVNFPNDDRRLTLKLPNAAFETDINQTLEEFHFGKFLPYADKSFKWIDESREYEGNTPRHSSEYEIKNAMVAEKILFSIHPEADEIRSSIEMGPLTVNYMPAPLSRCFLAKNASKVILWNPTSGECFLPEERNIGVETTSAGNRFMAFRYGEDNRIYTFFPELSPWAMDKEMKIVRDSPLRVFSKRLFESKPTLFLFGQSLAYYNKDEDLWEGGELKLGEPAMLPWMGFELTMLRHQDNKVPGFAANGVLPIHKNGEILKGATRALQMNVRGQEYWITNEKALALLVDGKKAEFYLTKESLTLPFELVLTNFKMDKDPGTNNPASYESFVRLFTSDGPSDHHIYMNNPLKFSGFTFYQASYSDNGDGSFSSTLSANVDQGRPLKYLGSLLLVFGAIWHYFLNRKRWKKRADLIATKDSIPNTDSDNDQNSTLQATETEHAKA